MIGLMMRADRVDACTDTVDTLATTRLEVGANALLLMVNSVRDTF